MRFAILIAALLGLSACHHETSVNTSPPTGGAAAAAAGSPRAGARVANAEHCELVNGPAAARGDCGRGAAKPAPAATPAAKPAEVSVAGFTPEDCNKTGWVGVAYAWGNLGRLEGWKRYCEEQDRRAAAAAAAPVAGGALVGGAGTQIVGHSGGCPLTRACQDGRAAQDRKLASYSARMAGLGVGAQYGFAWCGAKATETAARSCAASLRAIGQHSCAVRVEAAANSAASQAAQAVSNGRAVGVDASRMVPCG